MILGAITFFIVGCFFTKSILFSTPKKKKVKSPQEIQEELLNQLLLNHFEYIKKAKK
jgi:hypothetical protein